jgi:hypothetical protein
MWQKTVVMTQTVVLLISLTACEEESPSPQEIVDAVVEAQNHVLTCEVETDMKASIPAADASWVQSFSGALNSNSREMRMHSNFDGIGEIIYLVDGIGYTGEVWEDEIEWWSADTASEEDWEELGRLFFRDSQIQQQIELLKTTRADVIGSEKVNRIDCYLLQLTPNSEQLWWLALQNPTVAFAVSEYDTPTEDTLQEMFPSFSVRQWVTKKTHFLTKAEVDITLELTPETMGWPDDDGEMTVEINLTLLVYNHNEPVDIVLPQEAEQLIE